MLSDGQGSDVQEQIRTMLRDCIESTLCDQDFILARSYWLENKSSNAKLLEPFGLLTTGAKEQNAALELIRAINGAAHDGKRTQGAAKYFALVARIQDGAYCRMCGDAHDLHVDHIKPTSKSGIDHVSNLQLLCASCNLGKGATMLGNLASALRVNSEDSISDGLRFLRLSLRSIEVRGRPLGRCDCGSLASDTRLYVVVRRPFAANINNLRVICENCHE